jgi:hypothetical protein
MRYDFSPLYRSTIGFDRLFDMLDQAAPPANWPPYNIEKSGDDQYRITMAVAGFSPAEIELVQKENTLFVAGQKHPEPEGARAAGRLSSCPRPILGSMETSHGRGRNATPRQPVVLRESRGRRFEARKASAHQTADVAQPPRLFRSPGGVVRENGRPASRGVNCEPQTRRNGSRPPERRFILRQWSGS